MSKSLKPRIKTLDASKILSHWEIGLKDTTMALDANNSSTYKSKQLPSVKNMGQVFSDNRIKIFGSMDKE